MHSNGTPVMTVDKALEQRITQGIRQAYPEDTILGEVRYTNGKIGTEFFSMLNF